MKIFSLVLFALLPSLAFATETRVLIVGDSQAVGPFGQGLDRLLRAEQNPALRVNTYASCGSTLEWWKTGHRSPCGYLQILDDGKIDETRRSTPIFETLLRAYQPHWVILEFGGNYRHWNSQLAIADIRASLDQIKAIGAKCLFVTGPDTRLYKEKIPFIRRILHEAVGDRCAYFDSYAITRYPAVGGDGLHYYGSAAHTAMAQSWLKKVYAFFVEQRAR